MRRAFASLEISRSCNWIRTQLVQFIDMPKMCGAPGTEMAVALYAIVQREQRLSSPLPKLVPTSPQCNMRKEASKRLRETQVPNESGSFEQYSV
eukprot:5621099-Amphidinium_carterae.2